MGQKPRMIDEGGGGRRRGASILVQVIVSYEHSINENPDWP